MARGRVPAQASFTTRTRIPASAADRAVEITQQSVDTPQSTMVRSGPARASSRGPCFENVGSVEDRRAARLEGFFEAAEILRLGAEEERVQGIVITPGTGSGGRIEPDEPREHDALAEGIRQRSTCRHDARETGHDPWGCPPVRTRAACRSPPGAAHPLIAP